MKRVYFFLTAMLLIFTSAGSRDTVASLDRAMVHAVGIDISDEGYSVTLQIFHPDGEGSDTKLDPGKSNMLVVSAPAATVERAVSLCEDKLGEFLFIGHVQVIVLGRGVEPKDPEGLFSYFLKSRESYLGVQLASTDGTARELLEAELTEGAVAAQNIVSVIERSRENSDSVACDLLSVLNSESGDYAMPRLKLEGSSEDKKKEQRLLSDGAQVFTDGRRSFTLDVGECAALAHLLGEEHRSVVELETDSDTAGFTLKSEGTEVSVLKQGDRLLCRFEVELSVQRDQSTAVRLGGELPLSELEKKLTSESQALSKRLYTEKTDLLNLTRRIKAKYPQVWLDCSESADTLLSLTYVEIKVSCVEK
ncbi:MAG: hypothetical protein IJ561_04490 [Ruminococcus sp.]|nr:hypothetical protein [Ruminococcus sp.]